jgi:hypothetical protein
MDRGATLPRLVHGSGLCFVFVRTVDDVTRIEIAGSIGWVGTNAENRGASGFSALVPTRLSCVGREVT